MIAIILRQPNGNGTYTARMGFTTGDTSVLLDGITCLPDYLESVSELAHRIDASRAMGAVPEPVEWSFDLIDWESTARRSVGILDGSVQLVGWVASLYVLPPGSGVWSAAILSETAFEVIGAPVTDGTISISCCERWVGNASTVGIGSNGSVVGIVVGGLDVTVKTNELPEPVVIERVGVEQPNVWFGGSPRVQYGLYVPQTRATAKQVLAEGETFAFICWNFDERDRLMALINADGAGIVATGKDFTSALVPFPSGAYAMSGSLAPSYYPCVYVKVALDFYNSEAATDVSLYYRNPEFPIAAGASDLVGWIDNGRTATPVSDSSVDPTNTVLSTRPRILTPDGFTCLTRIDCNIAWAAGATPPYSEVDYFGRVKDIATAPGEAIPAWSSYSAGDIKPDAGSSSFTFWGALNTTNRPIASIPLRIYANPENTSGFDGFMVDFQSRAVIRNTTNSATSGKFSFPLTAIPDAVRYADVGSTDESEFLLKGNSAYSGFQRAATLDAINALPDLRINYPASFPGYFYINYQIAAVHLYGVSNLSPGSAHAVVTPGPAPWWTSQRTPSEAAQDLLDAVGFPIAGIYPINAPSVVPTVSQWGRSFEPNVTLWGAASEICSEFWLYAGRDSATIATAAADGEILGPPAFTLGDRNDTATEFVIEFDEWAGSYRQRAYIAHVDEAYDYTNPGRYYGGFGAWGLNLWNACHAAWMHHGAKIERTIQMPSVRDPELMGKLWAQSTRGGLARIRWASLQSRYVTFRIAETVPTWWAGDAVYIPTVAAGLAGYDLTQYASVPLIVTSKAWDPMTLETTLEVALPPTIPASGGTVIQQTFNASDDPIQQTPNFTDDLIKQVA